MPDFILPDAMDENFDVDHYQALLDDYRQRMSPRKADKYIGRAANTIKGALERKEIRYYRDGTRKKVTPLFLAEWLEKYSLVEADPLPG